MAQSKKFKSADGFFVEHGFLNKTLLYARAIGKDFGLEACECEDIASGVHAKICEREIYLRIRIESARAFVYEIVRNEVLDYLQKKNHEQLALNNYGAEAKRLGRTFVIEQNFEDICKVEEFLEHVEKEGMMPVLECFLEKEGRSKVISYTCIKTGKTRSAVKWERQKLRKSFISFYPRMASHF